MAYNTWTNQVLYPAPLNENFTLITAALHSITGGQMAADAINAGTIIAADIVDETHLDYADTVNPVRVLQIGKETTPAQMLVKGTCIATIAAVTIQDVTFVYGNADCVTGGEPVFTEVPHVIATCYTDDTDYVCDVKQAGTTNCVVQAGPGAGNIIASQVIYVVVVGNL